MWCFSLKIISSFYDHQNVDNCRKAAQKWHPDNFRGEEKKMAEKKFIDIAAAKEVLTDPGNYLWNSCY